MSKNTDAHRMQLVMSSRNYLNYPLRIYSMQLLQKLCNFYKKQTTENIEGIKIQEFRNFTLMSLSEKSKNYHEDTKKRNHEKFNSFVYNDLKNFVFSAFRAFVIKKVVFRQAPNGKVLIGKD